MTSEGSMRRRWPAALLALVAALLIGSAAQPDVLAGPADPSSSHAVVGASHVTDGLVALAHPRASGQLPAALPASGPSLERQLATSRSSGSAEPARSLADSAPTAIRGPPA